MSEIVLRSAAKTQLTVVEFTHRLVAHFGEVAERARRGESGQDVFEYAGMLLLVCAIIAALLALPIKQDVSNAVKGALDSIGIKV